MKGSRATPRIWQTDWLLLRALAKQLREQAECHIQPKTFMVDFGCGDSPYAEMMRQLNIHYCGADIDDNGMIKIDQQGRVPLADGVAGAVLSVQVLEHVRDLDAYCVEIRRLLSDDGLLLLSTHGTWLYHPHPEDHRRWTRTGLIADLTDRGFVVEDVEALVGPLATTTMLRLTGFAFFLRRLPIIGGILASGLSVIMNLRALFEDYVTPAHIRYDNACVFLLRARKAP